MRAAEFARQSDPSCNPQFSRAWTWPPPRTRRAPPGKKAPLSQPKTTIGTEHNRAPRAPQERVA
jgi:hypothetical protein